MTLDEAKKILNNRNIRDGKLVMDASKVYFKEMFGVDVQKSDGSYKTFNKAIEEASDNMRHSKGNNNEQMS